MRIVLTKGGSVSGKTYLGGRPLGMGECTVTAAFPDANATLGAMAVDTTNGLGAYKLTALTPGRVALRAYMSREFLPAGLELWLEKAIDITEDGVSTADFHFEGRHNALVEGTVVCGDDTIQGGQIELRADCGDGFQVCYCVMVQPDGHYRVEGLPAGTLQGRIRGKLGRGPSVDREFTVQAQQGRLLQQDVIIEP